MTQTHVDRLVDLARSADPKTRHWYRDEHKRIRATVKRIAGRDAQPEDFAAFAALSPQLGIEANRKAFEAVVSVPELPRGILKRNAQTAVDLIYGRRPLGVLSGPKVLAFYSNLRDPNGSLEVTVDSHAYRARQGNPTANVRPLERPAMYQRVAADYRAAANELGWLPSEAQAAVWCEWRRRHGLRGRSW